MKAVDFKTLNDDFFQSFIVVFPKTDKQCFGETVDVSMHFLTCQVTLFDQYSSLMTIVLQMKQINQAYFISEKNSLHCMESTSIQTWLYINNAFFQEGASCQEETLLGSVVWILPERAVFYLIRQDILLSDLMLLHRLISW